MRLGELQGTSRLLFPSTGLTDECYKTPNTTLPFGLHSQCNLSSMGHLGTLGTGQVHILPRRTLKLIKLISWYLLGTR